MKALEEEVRTREKALKDKESARKQIVLRLSPSLWADIAKWADEDFRSINGQIEYILTDAVNRRKK
ncbi:MAG: Arc family DNA-binding protein [Oscillospiraceae bacterium]|nr:Arc family DNA-binding protein [Oscillospiraceae bacterium]